MSPGETGNDDGQDRREGEQGATGDREQHAAEDDVDRERGPPVPVEMVVIAVSTLFTLALFGFVLWQATLASTAVAPTAHVVGSAELPGGDERVEVAVENDQPVGIASVTVAVHCTSPPAQMTFEHVPVDGRRTGFVVCPPGTGTPEVSVTGWVEA